MQTKLVKTDDVELASEAFGNPNDPAILLIMGAMASMLWWPKEFCQRLADKGRYVIRYDNRDTGLSTNYPVGKPEYSFDDMADDAIRVLDGYGISSAHIVGMSMGGMIAQLVALKYPERSRTLTLISTSPVGVDTAHLPGMTAAYTEHSASYADLDWSDRTQVVEFMLADVRAISSTRHPFDERHARDFIAMDYDRARRFESATNHFRAFQRRSTRRANSPAFKYRFLLSTAPLIPSFPSNMAANSSRSYQRRSWSRLKEAVMNCIRTTGAQCSRRWSGTQ